MRHEAKEGKGVHLARSVSNAQQLDEEITGRNRNSAWPIHVPENRFPPRFRGFSQPTYCPPILFFHNDINNFQVWITQIHFLFTYLLISLLPFHPSFISEHSVERFPFVHFSYQKLAQL
jgi:hypothetical protein